jgi:integrase
MPRHHTLRCHSEALLKDPNHTCKTNIETMLITYLDNNFVVEIKHHPKKNKTERDNYDLYLMFTIVQHELVLGTTVFNIGMGCRAEQWGNPKTLPKGTTPFAKSANNLLNSYENKAKMLLENAHRLKNCEQIKTAIQTVIRTGVTGKVERGQKRAMMEKRTTLSVGNVITKIKTPLRRGERPLSASRKRMYDSVYDVLMEYFEGQFPLLESITRQHLLDFKNWYYRTYKHKPETRSTYLGMIAAIFRFTVDELECISHSPIPKGFTPIVKKKDRKERRILKNNEIKKLYGLKEEDLAKNEIVAINVMMLQVTTGMAFCDLTSLRPEQVKCSMTSGGWQVRKQRSKSGETLTVTLSQRARYAFDNLHLLAGGTETLFDLPDLRTLNRKYKRIAAPIHFPSFTSYNLRHSFAVHFMDHGGKIEDLADILGHVKLETTRIYAKISESRSSQTMKSMSQGLINQL